MLARAITVAALLWLAAPASALPPGFEQETLATGLTQPVAVAFVPDGRMLVLEKPGRLKVVTPPGTTAQTIYAFEHRVNEFHDRGALGLAVDSDFADNPYVYLLYDYELQPLTPDTDAPMVGQLLRLRLAEDNTLSEPTVIAGAYTSGPCPAPANDVDCIPADADTHGVGTVRSAPDGTLFFGSGDAAEYTFADPVALRTYDERSMAGKILHTDRNGNGLAGRPYCPSSTDLGDVCTKVWAKGFRNPFRFTLRPDGGVAVGDVGWVTTEEVNLIPAAGGRSYGWPCYEGDFETGLYDQLEGCQAIYAEDAQTGPDVTWPHDGGDAAAMAGPTYTGTRYPAGFAGALFYGDYAAGWVDYRRPDGTTTRFIDDNAGVVDLEADLDGDLVQVGVGDFSDGSGVVTAIRHCPASNCAPVARLEASDTSGLAPLTVSFDGTGSQDPEGDAFTYRWDFGDGATSTAAAPSHTFATPGTWTVTLTVTDGQGRSSAVSEVITAGNSAPVAAVDAPATYRDGVPVQLSGTGTDQQDGALDAGQLSWRVVLHHGGHLHALGDLSGAQPTFTPRTDHDADSHYEVTLTARDSGGLTGGTTVRLDPETVPLTITSEPPGAPVNYAGAGLTTPFSAVAAIGFEGAVDAAQTFVAGGVEHTFAGWSDGGAKTHAITIPDTPLELVARYAPPAPPPATPTPAPSSTPTPSPSPTPTPTPDAREPTAYLGVRPVDVDRRRRATVYFTCRFFDTRRCRGTATLRFRGTAIARRRFSARVDRSRALLLRLTRRGFRRLARRGRLRVRFVVDPRGADAVRERITLRRRQIKP